MKILDNNERAYFIRYGIHLSEKLSSLSEGELEKAFNTYLSNTLTASEFMLSFDRSTILRIVIGCGDGHGINGITENSLSTLRALIWEPDEAYFLICCCHADMSKLIEDARLMFAVGRNKADIELAVRMNLFDFNYCHSKIVAQGQYIERDDRDVRSFSDILEAVSEEVTMGGRLGRALDTQPCENVLSAISLLNDNSVVSQLLEAVPVRDIPVIIVSAGPSLMKNCKELIGAKNRAIVVAVAHAMKTLYREGIIPDLVAVSDGAELEYLDCDSENRHTLLGSIFTNKEIQHNYNGRIIFHGFRLQKNLFSTKRTLDEPEIRLNTGSVATDVFSIFLSAGFKRIILVGQDLAYDADGYSHTECETEAGLYDRNDVYTYTDGIDGKRVRTRHDWEDFKKIFEGIIEENRDVRVIDATEGGALIHGTEVMTLSKALASCCDGEYPLKEWITGVKKGDEEEKEYISQWFDTAIWDAERMGRYLDEIIMLNEHIRSEWENRDSWDDAFSAQCRKYDVLYKQIIEGAIGDLLRFYCTKEIHTYNENSMVLVGDENIVRRMQLEYNLFTGMRNKSKELLGYITGLITE